MNSNGIWRRSPSCWKRVVIYWKWNQKDRMNTWWVRLLRMLWKEWENFEGRSWIVANTFWSLFFLTQENMWRMSFRLKEDTKCVRPTLMNHWHKWSSMCESVCLCSVVVRNFTAFRLVWHVLWSMPMEMSSYSCPLSVIECILSVGIYEFAFNGIKK